MKKIVSCLLAIPLVLFLIISIRGCLNNDQPKPKNPITFKAIPRKITKITGHWKMGEFIIGYSILTDDYILITDRGGLFGQEGQGLVGPGCVNLQTVRSFGVIVDVANRAKTISQEMNFFGDLRYYEDGTMYLYGGKKVVYLYNAQFEGESYEVNRRYWDN